MEASKSEDKQLLTVSSPCLLLNHIAQRYSRTSRIIMEYVDNSLDDAEALYDENTKSYSRHINILVDIKRLKVLEPQEDLGTKTKLILRDGSGSSCSKIAEATHKPKKKKTRVDGKWITEVKVTDNCRGMNK